MSFIAYKVAAICVKNYICSKYIPHMPPPTPNQREYTFSISLANLLALPFGAIIAVILLFPFITFWHPTLTDSKIITTMAGSTWAFFAISLSLIVAHELLHGITAAHYSVNGWKSVSFGVKWCYLCPYCHCCEPLKLQHFRHVCLMPLWVLGLLPIVIAFATGFLPLLMWGILLTTGSIGDIIAVLMTRKVPRDARIIDHPHALGFYVEQ